jgi:hypothetical protein
VAVAVAAAGLRLAVVVQEQLKEREESYAAGMQEAEQKLQDQIRCAPCSPARAGPAASLPQHLHSTHLLRTSAAYAAHAPPLAAQ